MKINILDSSVYNRISAGEVVENPASIVKELVENSIDAGATFITIKIKEGGIKYIEVLDNGIGIAKEELSKTIVSHATSKVATASDLDSIATLGFRGEALASIASVSEIEIKTRYLDSQTGAVLHAKNDIVDINDCAFNNGTKITITNLFHNTPVRFKFLRTKRGETGAVNTLISQLILSNPTVAFAYYVDDKLFYNSSGQGLLSAISAIYPTEISDRLIELVENDNKIKVWGYISQPELVKNNKSFQTIIVNGRIISDNGISATIQNAYGDRLMHRCFPIVVINIVMPFDEVDINVHPNKKEVRFASARQVYGAIYNSIRDSLLFYEYNQRDSLISSGKKIDLLNTPDTKNTIDKSAFSEKTAIIKDNAGANYINDTNHDNLDLNNYIQSVLLGSRADKVSESNNSFIMEKIAKLHAEKDNEALSNTASALDIEQTTPEKSINVATVSDEILADQLHDDSIGDLDSFRVVGQVFNTYMIIESNNNMIIIDQHAAHERLLYNQIVDSVDKGEIGIQPLLIPYIYEGQTGDIADILDIKSEFETLGFEIAAFGNNSIKISGVPILLSGLNLDKFITQCVLQLKGGDIKLSGILREKLMQIACKSAIKGGDTLSAIQIKHIINYFINENIPLKCPHGRPAYVSYSKNELEKIFRRKI